MNPALKVLQLKARQQVYTLLSGQNLSKLYGEGYDFSELREYQIGDDIKKINWMVSAKLGKPYIKEYHANRELSVVVAAFMDGSLYFGSKHSSCVDAKQKTLTEVASILGYAAQQNGDLFTGIHYTQDKSTSTPTSKQRYHVEQFSKTLYESSLLHSMLDYTDAAQNLFFRLQKPSLLFVLGDFLEDIDLSILSQKHEIVAIIVRNREEEFPKKLAEVTLKSPKSGSILKTYFGKKSIENYKKRLDENDTRTLSHFEKYGIRHTKIYTDEKVMQELISLFV